MIIKNQTWYNYIEGVDIEIVSYDDHHFIAIYNENTDSSVSFNVSDDNLKDFAEFIIEYLENN